MPWTEIRKQWKSLTLVYYIALRTILVKKFDDELDSSLFGFYNLIFGFLWANCINKYKCLFIFR